jgi:hypothetical protein
MKQTKRTTRSANNRLEQAMTELAQAQTSLIRSQALFLEYVEARFAGIESMLLRHQRILAGLPEAVRRTIGFKVSES